MMRQQQVAQAITGYVDSAGVSKVCPDGCIESTQWSSRTREFVGEVFDYMNGLSLEERLDFRAALAGGAKPSTSPAT